MADTEATKRIREIRNVLSNNGRQCFFNKTEIGVIIGKHHPDAINRFVDDVPAVVINGRKSYFVNDIARKLYHAQTM